MSHSQIAHCHLTVPPFLLLLLLLSAFATTITFGQESIEEPPPNNTSGAVMSCYYATNQPPVEAVDPFLCTHLLHIGSCNTFENGTISFPNKSEVADLLRLKRANPKNNVLVTLTPRNPAMTKITSSKELTTSTSIAIFDFLTANNLDGFDIDWEFPVWSSDASKSDKKNLTKFLKVLRHKFDKGANKRLVLTMAVAAPYDMVEQAYDVPELNRYLDFVNVMNYDFHTYSKDLPLTGYNAPLFPSEFESWIPPLKKLNAAYSTVNWVKRGMQKEKVLMGIPTYARGFTLMFSFWHHTYAPAIGDSAYGSSLTYGKVCEVQKMGGYVTKWDSHSKVPYTYNEGKQWLSYETDRSVIEKTKFAVKQGFGGVMVFDLICDDWNNTCGHGVFPLTKAVKKTLEGG